MHSATYHTPVLLRRVLSFLFTRPDGIYVDATLGGGGHAEALLERLTPDGRLLGIDADADAHSFAARRLARFGPQAELVHDNFRNLGAILAQHSLTSISGIVFDLGVSSYQLDTAHRGFSFQLDEQLDMRMDRRLQQDAATIVNTYSVRQLTEIFRQYGEIRQAQHVAARINRARARATIRTTRDLARIVSPVAGERTAVKTLARVFQAIRIEVNDELQALTAVLPAAINALEPGGRVVVLAYHSLEDRIVKHQFQEASASSRPAPSKLAPPELLRPQLRLLTRSPVEADQEETRLNPRARSAKLRAAEKLPPATDGSRQ